MEYRQLGGTGKSASVIGLGAEHLDGKPYAVAEETIQAALKYGINIMDVFMPGPGVRRNIGKALGADRKKMIIQGHVGSVDLLQQYDISRDLETCKRYFAALLDGLGTDYIDVGMLFFMDSEEAIGEIYANGVVDYMLDLKRQGVIHAIGASAHNPRTARKLAESGLIELLMFSINPAFDLTPADHDVLSSFSELESQRYAAADPVRAELYRYCEQRNIAVTVMKAFGGGRLLTAGHSPFGKAMSTTQCIHYALTRPGVTSVMAGCQSEQQVKEAVAYLSASAEEKDYIPIIGDYTGGAGGHCVYCNHCQPCPARIDIAAVNKYLDIAELDPEHVPPSVRQHYRSLNARGSDCVGCGSCEKKCPFAVPVVDKMKRAAELFGP